MARLSETVGHCGTALIRMGEYERMVIDFLVIVSAPTLAPHLDVVALVLVVLALAVLVALQVVLPISTAGLVVRPVTSVVMPLDRAGVSRGIRSLVRARALSDWMLPAHA